MNIFVDCGFYRGLILGEYIKEGIVDESWIVYAFDPNPELGLKKDVKRFPMNIKAEEKAVWVNDTVVDFTVSNVENASSIDGTTSHAPKKTIIVQAFDFSEFVRRLPEAYIICSMDIEGAEYAVLEKMLVEDTISKIDLLDIEFHHRFMLEEDLESTLDLVRRIEEEGVKVKLKVPLS